MPDPIVFLKALTAAMLTSAFFVFAGGRMFRQTGPIGDAAWRALAPAPGLMAGYAMLDTSWRWPPASALDRFFTIILPLALVLELVSALVARRPRVHWLLRWALCAVAGRILLHGSVYLNSAAPGDPLTWSPVMQVLLLSGMGGAWGMAWISLHRLSDRASSGSITVCIAFSILTVGLVTMLGGYLKGGASAIPPAAALLGTTLAGIQCRPVSGTAERCDLRSVDAIGLTSLFSLALIGRFFGQMTSEQAIIICLSPLLCWVTELPVLRSMTDGQKAVLRCIIVAIPLAVVLTGARNDFERRMRPLLSDARMSPWDRQQTGPAVTSAPAGRPSGPVAILVTVRRSSDE